MKVTVRLLAAMAISLSTIAVWAVTGYAQLGPSVPNQISFQARVTGPGGAPVADGTYPVQFTLYTTSTGEPFSEIWTEETSVTVGGGVFTHNLGSTVGYPLNLQDVSDADSLWLEVTFDGEVLDPLTRVVSNLYSATADLLETHSGSSPSRIGIRTTSSHQLSQYGSDGGEQGRLWGPNWGELILDAAAINGTTDDVLLTSNNGDGGVLQLRKAAGLAGASLRGGSPGSGATLGLTDAVGSTTVFLDGNQTGDAAVQVPAGAISAIEEFNEPGVASTNSTTISGLTGTLLSRSITVPSAGYVLAIGSCQIGIAHTSGTTDSAAFAVSSDGSFPVGSTLKHEISGSVPSGEFYEVITVHSLFPVSAGVNTFSLLGTGTPGAYGARTRQLSLVFIPTAYGTVSAPASPGGNGDLSAADSNVKGETFEVVRLRRELDSVRSQAEETTRRLTELEAQMARNQAFAGPEN